MSNPGPGARLCGPVVEPQCPEPFDDAGPRLPRGARMQLERDDPVAQDIGLRRRSVLAAAGDQALCRLNHELAATSARLQETRAAEIHVGTPADRIQDSGGYFRGRVDSASAMKRIDRFTLAVSGPVDCPAKQQFPLVGG